ncbi:MAG: hypothetical protein ACTSU4_15365 [Promethearchaeota archaeon]
MANRKAPLDYQDADEKEAKKVVNDFVEYAKNEGLLSGEGLADSMISKMREKWYYNKVGHENVLDSTIPYLICNFSFPLKRFAIFNPDMKNYKEIMKSLE